MLKRVRRNCIEMWIDKFDNNFRKFKNKKQGHGDAVCLVLARLAKLATDRTHRWQQPLYPDEALAEVAEEASDDEEDEVEEQIIDDDDDDPLYSEVVNRGVKNEGDKNVGSDDEGVEGAMVKKMFLKFFDFVEFLKFFDFFKSFDLICDYWTTEIHQKFQKTKHSGKHNRPPRMGSRARKSHTQIENRPNSF